MKKINLKIAGKRVWDTLRDIDKRINFDPPGIENLKAKHQECMCGLRWLKETHVLNEYEYLILKDYLYERFYHLYWLHKCNEVSK